MTEEASEKQHLATARRLAELRKQGTVMRSRDLSGGLIFIVLITILMSASTKWAIQFAENFKLSFTGIRQLVLDPTFLAHFIHKIALANFTLLLPIFILGIVTVFATPFIFGGWNFSLTAVGFNFNKMNPINNLKRIFSPAQAAKEIVRSMLKCLVIIGSLIYFMFDNLSIIKELINYPVNVAMHVSYHIIKDFIIVLAVMLIFLIIIDVLYQYFQFQKQAKMSTQEMKDEYKDTEGSVEMKRKIRSAQFAAFRQRLAISVPRASVILTNPTHYAIALKYDDKKDRAPKVLAKGKDHIAQQIRLLAIANGIPIYEAPPLARAIFHTTKVNAEIHPELYMSVAIVLSYVHQLKNYQSGKGNAPVFVSDFTLPKEFDYQE